MGLDIIGPMVDALRKLERRGVITTNSADAEKCCGMERDSDGFCQYRGHHPIYVEVL